MRPIKLILSAFGSYGGVNEIDFSRMDSGIFLITGDTGAGKTTIFDAISYALYDIPSGNDREPSMLRSKMASSTEETYVDFTFEYRKEVYRIKRNPDYMRLSRKKAADGTYKVTKETANVSLFYEDGSEYIGKKKDINAEIVRILGLDASQFKQVSMLAQGEFRKLLFASSEERKAIFAKIFGTKTYEDVTEKLKIKAKSNADVLNEVRAKIEYVLGGIYGDEELSKRLEELKSLQWIPEKEVLELLQLWNHVQGGKEASIVKEYEDVQNSFIRVEAQYKSILENNKRYDTLKNEISAMDMRIKKTLEEIGYHQDFIAEHSQKKEESLSTYKKYEEQYEKNIPIVEQKLSYYQRYDKVKTEYEMAEKDYQSTILEVQKQKERFSNLYDGFIRSQAGILASGLQENEPCPVCGSTHHPRKAILQEDIASKEEVDRAKQGFEKAEAARQKQADIYNEKKNVYEEICVYLVEKGEDISGKDFDIREKIEKVQYYIKALNNNRNLARKQYEDLISQIAKSEGELKNLKKRLPEDRSRLEELKSQFLQTERLDDSALEIQSKDLKGKLQEIDKQRMEMHRRISVLEDALQKLPEYFIKYKKIYDEYIIYERLSKIASGNISGSVKLDFETYVQRFYFKQIVAKANQRLIKMSNNTFLLKTRDLKEASLRSKEGLNLDIVDINTSASRDVKSLSGGEGFMASLSMALGLSDMIGETCGAIQIETMFIDEGFGSLDDRTRALAIETLESLSSGKKLIGIISHVSELKEQIDAKLIVKKGDKGSLTYWEGV